MEALPLAALMGIVGLVTSIVAAALTVAHSLRKSRAESILVKSLRENIETVQHLRDIEARLRVEQADVSEVYVDLLRALQVATNSLPENERKKILEGLAQRSELGRANYARKLVAESTSVAAQPG